LDAIGRLIGGDRIAMQEQRRRCRHATGWIAAIGFGLITGCLVGLGLVGSYSHVRWPLLAGLGLGVAIALAVRERPVLAAAACSSVAVLTAMSTVGCVQVGRGNWPVSDESTIAHYGTASQALLRLALALFALVVVPCVVAAFTAAFVRRRAGPRARSVREAG